MKRFIALILAVLMCFSLCACGGDGTQSKEDLGSTAEEETTQAQVSAEFVSALYGEWKCMGGAAYDLDTGDIITFYENGTCKMSPFLNGDRTSDKELTWDITFKTKYWTDVPKEFINLYQNGILVYEGTLYIDTEDESKTEFRVGVASEGEGMAAYYMKKSVYDKLHPATDE